MTSFDPLSMLLAGVGAKGTAQASQQRPGAAAFAELLGIGGASASTSGEVTVAKGLDLALTDEQKLALSRVIDLAADSGVVTLMVQDGERSLVIDVQNRTITRVAAPGEIVAGVDGAVTLERSHTDHAPPAEALSASLLRALAGSARS